MTALLLQAHGPCGPAILYRNLYYNHDSIAYLATYRTYMYRTVLTIDS